MVATISTRLETTADRAWREVKKTSTFLHVTRGVLGVRATQPLPDEWHAGDRVHARLLLFNVVPAWIHELRVVRVDDTQRELCTNEGGGPMPVWNHRITVAPKSPGCRYTDQVEIDAGVLTPMIWLYAHLFFRYRQWRLRRLVRGV